MKEKLELMFNRLTRENPNKDYIKLTLHRDFSGNVKCGGFFADNERTITQWKDFFSWLDEFTDPNAEKRKELHELQDQIAKLRARENELWNQLHRADDLPF